MKFYKVMSPLFSCLLGVSWVGLSNAEEARQLEAHEHGVGQLNIAIEGTSVAMELEAPGADIVGFEYAATSAEDRALIDQGLARLASPLDLFVLPEAAQCVATAANVALKGDEHEEHDDHADDEHHEDEHEEHAENDADHADHAEHEGDVAAEDSHTEFRAEYNLTCAAPEAITAIEFAYFEHFPNAQELELQVITDQGASAYEIERDNPVLTLNGLM